MKNNLTLLGDLSVKEFLRDYWQKKPLLIRQAIPGFQGLLDPRELMELACSPDALARLVENKRGLWHLQQGPFDTEELSRLGKNKWTILLQGLNHVLPTGAELLKQFNFIPHSRLDDLMVSYAPKGGGVGPHFDSYDVFLLQGKGHRRWQISGQKDRTLIEGAPLKILQNFTMEHEWILEPGDMLYLPPQWAHNGIAEDDCMTYSIGFRAPSYQEIAEQFLVYLQDRICIEGIYSDPELKLQAHPSEISTDMLHQVGDAIKKIQWDKADIANFLGCYLSEPKAHIFFDAPEKPWSQKRFLQALTTKGIALDLKAQMLCHKDTIFINGEPHHTDKETYQILRTLADTRRLQTTEHLSNDAIDLLYQCYLDGFILPIEK